MQRVQYKYIGKSIHYHMHSGIHTYIQKRQPEGAIRHPGRQTHTYMHAASHVENNECIHAYMIAHTQSNIQTNACTYSIINHTHA